MVCAVFFVHSLEGVMLKSKFKRYLVLPDVHAPFHDEKLLTKICRYIKDSKPDGFVLLGDFLDLYSLSRWNQNSLYKLKDLTLTIEYDSGIKTIQLLEMALPKGIEKHFLYGNHEDRFERFLQEGDTAKIGNELRRPEEALRLKERGYEVHRDWRDDAVRLGEHLDVVHGLYAPINAAKKHADEFQGSVIFGHTHRFGAYVDGKRGAYNIGCLVDRDSIGFRYEPRVKRLKWIQGFAEVNIASTGEFWVNMVQVWNGGFIANGKLY